MQSAQADLVDNSTSLQFMERDARKFGLLQGFLEVFETGGLAARRAGPKLLRRKLRDYGTHAAIVIDARIGHDEIVDLEDFARAQKRRDDRLAGIEIADGGAAGVDQHHFG